MERIDFIKASLAYMVESKSTLFSLIFLLGFENFGMKDLLYTISYFKLKLLLPKTYDGKSTLLQIHS